MRFVLDYKPRDDDEVSNGNVDDYLTEVCVIQRKAPSNTFSVIADELSLPMACLGARLHNLLTARKCSNGDHGVDVSQVRNYGINLTIGLASILIVWFDLHRCDKVPQRKSIITLICSQLY